MDYFLLDQNIFCKLIHVNMYANSLVFMFSTATRTYFSHFPHVNTIAYAKIQVFVCTCVCIDVCLFSMFALVTNVRVNISTPPQSIYAHTKLTLNQSILTLATPLCTPCSRHYSCVLASVKEAKVDADAYIDVDVDVDGDFDVDDVHISRYINNNSKKSLSTATFQ